MSSSVVRQYIIRKSPPQPIDRHLSEIGENDGSIYINAGIDSTCCKKRGRTIHQLTNGIMMSSSQPQVITRRMLAKSGDDLVSALINDNSNDDQFDSMNSQDSQSTK